MLWVIMLVWWQVVHRLLTSAWPAPSGNAGVWPCALAANGTRAKTAAIKERAEVLGIVHLPACPACKSQPIKCLASAIPCRPEKSWLFHSPGRRQTKDEHDQSPIAVTHACCRLEPGLAGRPGGGAGQGPAGVRGRQPEERARRDRRAMAAPIGQEGRDLLRGQQQHDQADR